PDVPHHQVVAVGRRLGDDVGGDRAAGARARIDQHRLPPALGQLLREVAREIVGGRARALAEDADRLRRKIRGGILGQSGDGEDQRQREPSRGFHAASSAQYYDNRPPAYFSESSAFFAFASAFFFSGSTSG